MLFRSGPNNRVITAGTVTFTGGEPQLGGNSQTLNAMGTASVTLSTGYTQVGLTPEICANYRAVGEAAHGPAMIKSCRRVPILAAGTRATRAQGFSVGIESITPDVIYGGDPVTIIAKVSHPATRGIGAGGQVGFFDQQQLRSAASLVAVDRTTKKARWVKPEGYSAGTHNICVYYRETDLETTQTCRTITVYQRAFAIELLMEPNPVAINSPVTFTAKVTGVSSQQPATRGNVLFRTQQGAIMQGAQAVNSQGTVVWRKDSSGGSARSESYCADYRREGSSTPVLASQCKALRIMTEVITEGIIINFTPAEVEIGELATFTATVRGPNNRVITAGTVTFTGGGQKLSSNAITLNAMGTASVTLSTGYTQVGLTPEICANYRAVGIARTVKKCRRIPIREGFRARIESITPNIIYAGEPITIIAKVDHPTNRGIGAGGQIGFFLSQQLVSAASLVTVSSSTRKATFVKPEGYSAGTYSICVYYREANVVTGRSCQSITVYRRSFELSLTMSANPVPVDTAVTFTAKVTGESSQQPVTRGNILFRQGTTQGSILQAAREVYSNGTVVWTKPEGYSIGGAQTICAVYRRDSLGSETPETTSTCETVNITENIVVNFTPEEVEVGELATFTATVRGARNRIITAGTVTFTGGGRRISSQAITLDARGTASIRMSERYMQVGRTPEICANYHAGEEGRTARRCRELLIKGGFRAEIETPGVIYAGEPVMIVAEVSHPTNRGIRTGGQIGFFLSHQSTSAATMVDVNTLTRKATFTKLEGYSAGSHSVCVYYREANVATDRSCRLITVHRRSFELSLTMSANPVPVDTTVTFTAKVIGESSQQPVTRGDVLFREGTLQGAIMQGAQAVNSQGTVVWTKPGGYSIGGAQTICAIYRRDSQGSSETSETTSTCETVNITENIVVNFTPEEVEVGELATFTATVRGARNRIITEGTVTFTGGGGRRIPSQAITLDARGTASIRMSGRYMQAGVTPEICANYRTGEVGTTRTVRGCKTLVIKASFSTEVEIVTPVVIYADEPVTIVARVVHPTSRAIGIGGQIGFFLSRQSVSEATMVAVNTSTRKATFVKLEGYSEGDHNICVYYQEINRVSDRSCRLITVHRRSFVLRLTMSSTPVPAYTAVTFTAKVTGESSQQPAIQGSIIFRSEETILQAAQAVNSQGTVVWIKQGGYTEVGTRTVCADYYRGATTSSTVIATACELITISSEILRVSFTPDGLEAGERATFTATVRGGGDRVITDGTVTFSGWGREIPSNEVRLDSNGTVRVKMSEPFQRSGTTPILCAEHRRNGGTTAVTARSCRGIPISEGFRVEIKKTSPAVIYADEPVTIEAEVSHPNHRAIGSGGSIGFFLSHQSISAATLVAANSTTKKAVFVKPEGYSAGTHSVCVYYRETDRETGRLCRSITVFQRVFIINLTASANPIAVDTALILTAKVMGKYSQQQATQGRIVFRRGETVLQEAQEVSQNGTVVWTKQDGFSTGGQRIICADYYRGASTSSGSALVTQCQPITVSENIVITLTPEELEVSEKATFTVTVRGANNRLVTEGTIAFTGWRREISSNEVRLDANGTVSVKMSEPFQQVGSTPELCIVYRYRGETVRVKMSEPFQQVGSTPELCIVYRYRGETAIAERHCRHFTIKGGFQAEIENITPSVIYADEPVTIVAKVVHPTNRAIGSGGSIGFFDPSVLQNQTIVKTVDPMSRRAIWIKQEGFKQGQYNLCVHYFSTDRMTSLACRMVAILPKRKFNITFISFPHDTITNEAVSLKIKILNEQNQPVDQGTVNFRSGTMLLQAGIPVAQDGTVIWTKQNGFSTAGPQEICADYRRVATISAAATKCETINVFQTSDFLISVTPQEFEQYQTMNFTVTVLVTRDALRRPAKGSVAAFFGPNRGTNIPTHALDSSGTARIRMPSELASQDKNLCVDYRRFPQAEPITTCQTIKITRGFEAIIERIAPADGEEIYAGEPVVITAKVIPSLNKPMGAGSQIGFFVLPQQLRPAATMVTVDRITKKATFTKPEGYSAGTHSMCVYYRETDLETTQTCRTITVLPKRRFSVKLLVAPDVIFTNHTITFTAKAFNEQGQAVDRGIVDFRTGTTILQAGRLVNETGIVVWIKQDGFNTSGQQEICADYRRVATIPAAATKCVMINVRKSPIVQTGWTRRLIVTHFPEDAIYINQPVTFKARVIDRQNQPATTGVISFKIGSILVQADHPVDKNGTVVWKNQSGFETGGEKVVCAEYHEAVGTIYQTCQTLMIRSGNPGRLVLEVAPDVIYINEKVTFTAQAFDAQNQFITTGAISFRTIEKTILQNSREVDQTGTVKWTKDKGYSVEGEQTICAEHRRIGLLIEDVLLACQTIVVRKRLISVVQPAVRLVIFATPENPEVNKKVIWTARVYTDLDKFLKVGTISFHQDKTLLQAERPVDEVGSVSWEKKGYPIGKHTVCAKYRFSAKSAEVSACHSIGVHFLNNAQELAKVQVAIQTHIESLNQSIQAQGDRLNRRLEILNAGRGISSFQGRVNFQGFADLPTSSVFRRMEENKPSRDEPFIRSSLLDHYMKMRPKKPSRPRRAKPSRFSVWSEAIVELGSFSSNGIDRDISSTTASGIVGIDAPFKERRMHLGIAASFSKNRSNLDAKARGGRYTMLDSFSVALYATYRMTKNLFADGYLEYGRLNASYRRASVYTVDLIKGERQGDYWSVSTNFSRDEGIVANTFNFIPYVRSRVSVGKLYAFTEKIINQEYNFKAVSTLAYNGTLGCRMRYNLSFATANVLPFVRSEYNIRYAPGFLQVVSHADSNSILMIQSQNLWAQLLSGGIGMRIDGKHQWVNRVQLDGEYMFTTALDQLATNQTIAVKVQVDF